MATKFSDKVYFDSISVVDGYIGVGSVNLSSTIQYSLTSFAAADRALQADEATAGNIAAVLATLISDLSKKGIVAADGGE